MDDRRCPLCGGILLEKICIDCGFESLTEEEIAAPYDFAPENDAFGEAEPPDDITEMESISAVYNEQKPEIVSTPQVNNNVPQKAAPKIHRVSSYNGSANTPVPPPSVGEMIVQDSVAAIKKHWWKMLLTLLFPIAGFLIGAVYCTLGQGVKKGDTVNFNLLFKGLGYIAAAAMLIKLGIGFGIS